MMKSFINRKLFNFIQISTNLNNHKFADIIPGCGQKTSQRLQHTKRIKCWKCGIEKQNIYDLFCPQCRIIQSPEDKHNYFKLLQQDEIYDVDLKILRDKYRHLQSVLHPDKFSNKSAEEKNISENFSSLVNKAYDIVQSPLKRAIHLLNLKGEKIREDEKIDDPKFLMNIMELNEQVTNASNADELKALNISNKKTLELLERKISEYFRENDLVNVKYCIIELRYYNSISLLINKIMREKGIVE
ncbi:iron-sulfur cluster co-chaperone protein HscB [Harmonia axyridis]|uniref:iron-sulfur cluster co-chaperone protein HscB n=1 Tax=Harmonia axyridis TaxID=115357 RepID=UPI001E277371|nr:iron-sulfur cluster co-chaperone protein HscB [Harmonia axyridis]